MRVQVSLNCDRHEFPCINRPWSWMHKFTHAGQDHQTWVHLHFMDQIFATRTIAPPPPPPPPPTTTTTMRHEFTCIPGLTVMQQPSEWLIGGWVGGRGEGGNPQTNLEAQCYRTPQEQLPSYLDIVVTGLRCTSNQGQPLSYLCVTSPFPARQPCCEHPEARTCEHWWSSEQSAHAECEHAAPVSEEGDG